MKITIYYDPKGRINVTTPGGLPEEKIVEILRSALKKYEVKIKAAKAKQFAGTVTEKTPEVIIPKEPIKVVSNKEGLPPEAEFPEALPKGGIKGSVDIPDADIGPVEEAPRKKK